MRMRWSRVSSRKRLTRAARAAALAAGVSSGRPVADRRPTSRISSVSSVISAGPSNQSSGRRPANQPRTSVGSASGRFGLWILANVGLVGGALVFDKFPFGLLTMVVSLEAIFLSTFVMVSQNRQAARADIRSQLDFETNLRAEIWSVHIGSALGVDVDHVEDVVRDAIRGSRSQLGDAAAGA